MPLLGAAPARRGILGLKLVPNFYATPDAGESIFTVLGIFTAVVNYEKW